MNSFRPVFNIRNIRIFTIGALLLCLFTIHENAAYGETPDWSVGASWEPEVNSELDETCDVEIGIYSAPIPCKYAIPIIVATGVGIVVKGIKALIKNRRKANRDQRIANEARAAESRKALNNFQCQEIQQMPELIRAVHSFNLLKTNKKAHNHPDRDAILRVYGCLSPEQLKATWSKPIMTAEKNRDGTWGKWIQKKLTEDQARTLRDILLRAGMNPQTELKKSTLKLTDS